MSSSRSCTSTNDSTAASRKDVNQKIFNQGIKASDKSFGVARIPNVENESITQDEALVFERNYDSEGAFVKTLQDNIIIPFLSANQASTLIA